MSTRAVFSFLFTVLAVLLLIVAAFATKGHDLFVMGWPFWFVVGVLSQVFSVLIDKWPVARARPVTTSS